MTAILPFFLMMVAIYIMKYSCNTFTHATDYLGRKLSGGIKGATVNAIGSSMPEFCVTLSCYFIYNDPKMVMLGLGLTAGSSIFNSTIIPAASILAAKNSDGSPMKKITLNRNTLIRDAIWCNLSQVALAVFLCFSFVYKWMAVALVLIYAGYAIHIYIDSKKHKAEEHGYQYESLQDEGIGKKINFFNMNKVLFKNKEYNLWRAIAVLLSAIVLIAISSNLLVEGILGVSNTLGIPEFFSGLVLGSAASSMPDLLISVKDAKNGSPDDSISNPLGSNTFNVTMAFGLPTLLWLSIHGADKLQVIDTNGLTYLKVTMVLITASVSALLVKKYNNIDNKLAYALLGIFALWCFGIYLLIGQ